MLAAAAFAIGLIVGSGGDDGRDAVTAYARAWATGDWAAMHAQLTPAAQERIGLLPFAAAERSALATATAGERSVTTGKPKDLGNDRWRVPVTVRTRIFGTVKGAVVIPVAQDGDARRVDWKPRLVFPDLRDGERLTRRTEMPERGTLTARDGTPLAQGTDRTSPIPDVAGQVVGKLGPISDVEAERVSQLGVPPTAQVGTGGLERVFDDRLGGLPSGVLLAGTRVIARAQGRTGERVRTTIDPALERVAVTALAGRYGGAVAFDPRTGAVLAYAGAPFSLLQPPGLDVQGDHDRRCARGRRHQDHLDLPVRESGRAVRCSPLERRRRGLRRDARPGLRRVLQLGLRAARREARRAAPGPDRRGVRLQPSPGVPDRRAEHDPQADAIGDDLAVGSSAIGQGQVQATAVQMAEAAGVIANRGRRRPLTLDLAAGAGDEAGNGRAGDQRSHRTPDAAPDAGRGRGRDRARRRRSPASRWRARPEPRS